MNRPAGGRRTWQQWVGLAFFLIVAFVVWATVTDKQQTTTPLTTVASEAPSPPAPAPLEVAPSVSSLSSADAAKQNDKGWVMEDFRLGADGAGGMDGTARIKNANPDTSTAFFTITLLDGQTALATWHGSANQVQSGTTVSVTMITQDPRPPNRTGHFSFQFQTDVSTATG